MFRDPAKFCAPPTVTNGQSRLVVVRYMENHPELLHLPFVKLAFDAIRRRGLAGDVGCVNPGRLADARLRES
jgi:hypothetical protein